MEAQEVLAEIEDVLMWDHSDVVIPPAARRELRVWAWWLYGELTRDASKLTRENIASLVWATQRPFAREISDGILSGALRKQPFLQAEMAACRSWVDPLAKLDPAFVKKMDEIAKRCAERFRAYARRKRLEAIQRRKKLNGVRITPRGSQPERVRVCRGSRKRKHRSAL